MLVKALTEESATAAKPTTRARRDLSAEEIVARATEVLRNEGEDALTMRRIAQECGVTPMAIYHHVADKDALIDAVMGHVLEPALLHGDPDPADARDELIEVFVRFRQVLVDNPGAGTIFVRRPVVNRATALVTEQAFALLEAGGLRGQQVPDVMDALVLVLLGTVSNDLTRPPTVREGLGEVLATPDAPRLHEHLDGYAHRDGAARFRQAIEWILDGVGFPLAR